MNVVEQRWYVYMVETECGVLYTGISTDIDRRFSEHCAVSNGGKQGAKFFRGKVAKAVVYREQCLNRSEASKREYVIKKLSAAKKRALINGAD
ncbi:endonuclease [Oleiphilus sp. HI0125]|nr:endonuclease [Oleiphilus sp. HI0066]KZY69254.1 endonuclease [Oleiphilus sp. HI0067]KZZ56904.1 endonuclease [Oleiphilus sp. HI0125]KZZ61395.1 endonuclease [Oleiphilus sp. HI0125]